MEPASPVIRGVSNWQNNEAARMNVTHTEGHKFGLEVRPPSVLDQVSNIKDREDKAHNVENAANSYNDQDD